MIGLPDAADLPLNDETWEQACLAAEERWVDDEHLLNAQRILAQAGRWDGVYVLSVLAGLETSVLIDADDKVFIDWGTAGQVTLQPPVGGRLPFKLWVHTHPQFAAYWSGTDVNSLSLGARILESAMVPRPTRTQTQQQPLAGGGQHHSHARRGRPAQPLDGRRTRAVVGLVHPQRH